MLRQRTVTGRCHYCNKEGDWKNECFKRKNDLRKSNGEGHLAFMGMANEVTGSTEWIIDSGESRHLTARHESLENYVSISPTSMTIGNGKEITAVGEGNMTLRTGSQIVSLSLESCMYPILAATLSVLPALWTKGSRSSLRILDVSSVYRIQES